MKRSKVLLIAAALIGAACGSDKTKPAIASFSAVPSVIAAGATTALTWSVNGATSLSVDNGIGVVTGSAVAVHPTVDTTYVLTATNAAGSVTSTVTVTIDTTKVAAGMAGFLVRPASDSPASGSATSLTVTAVDAKGATVPYYTGTVHFTTDDAQATVPADLVFAAADQGVKSASFTPITAGTVHISVADAANASLTGSGFLHPKPGIATSLKLSALPSAAVAGDALPLIVTALDSHGNVADAYTGTVTVTADAGAGATLPAAHAYTAADAGLFAFAVSLSKSGSHTVTVSDGTLSAQQTVAVDAASAAQLALPGFNDTATAGDVLASPLIAQDRFGNKSAGYRGTVHFVLSDANVAATKPADYTFLAADQGATTIHVTFATTGPEQILAADSAQASVRGSATVQIGPAAASQCTAVGIPAAARAGDPLAMRLTLWDPFGNLATGYAGTMSFTSTDARATRPAPFAYGSADAGAHDFSVRFGTLGSQGVTATDSSSSPITCNSAQAVISAGPASTFAISGLANSAIAGSVVPFTVTAEDSYGNVALDYAGPVDFSSSDTGARFTGGVFSSGTAADQTVAFTSIGGQTVLVTDHAKGFSAQFNSVAVHGLVYTAPGASQALQLVADPSSTAAQMVLRLVAGSAVPVAYSAGFNIKADASRATVVSIAQGNALNPGTSPAAMAAALGGSGVMANVLSAGISQKATDTTVNAAIAPGQVLYTLVLHPTSTSAGVVFDGSAPFRAAVRDLEGNELLSQGDFGVGKLEIQ